MHDRLRTIKLGACQNQVVQNKWSRFVRIQQRSLTKGRLISISFGKFSFHHEIEWPPRPGPHSLRSGGGASVLCSTFLGVGDLFFTADNPECISPGKMLKIVIWSGWIIREMENMGVFFRILPLLIPGSVPVPSPTRSASLNMGPISRKTARDENGEDTKKDPHIFHFPDNLPWSE